MLRRQTLAGTAVAHCAMPLLAARRWMLAGTPLTRRIYTARRESVKHLVEPHTNFHECMMQRLEGLESETAFVCGETDRHVMYTEFKQQCESYARELYHMYGVRHRSVVLLSAPNMPEYGSMVHAVLRSGGVVSPINPLSTAEMLAQQAERSGATTIATTREHASVAHEAAVLVEKQMGTQIRVFAFDGPLQAAEPIPESYSGTKGSGLEDTIMLPFSSGTTGRAKGVQLTNRNVIANMFQMAAYMPSQRPIVSLAVLPFFHIYGLNVLLNELLFLGSTLVTMKRFDIVRFLSLIEKYKVTHMNLAPPMLVMMMRQPDLVAKYDLRSVKDVCCAAAPMAADVQRKAELLFPNGTLMQGYGMTEASPTAVVSEPGSYGDVGMVLGDTEMRIVKITADQQSGSDESSCIDVEVGEQGEVWLRGPQIMKGYLDAEDNATAMVGDWYRTGDIGYADEDGRLYITDRLKELIKYKGFQVAPAELEGIILLHPSVADVIVVGVPDAADPSSELPRAQVVLKPEFATSDTEATATSITDFVADRVLHYKRLSGGIRFVDAVPKNPAGKLLRRTARLEEVQHLKTVAAQ